MKYTNILIVIVIVVGSSILGYLAYNKYQATQKSELQTENTGPTPTPIQYSSIQNQILVEYTPDESFNPMDKMQLATKYAQPISEYYITQPENKVSKIQFTENTNDTTGEYPFNAKIIFENGAISEQLIKKTYEEIEYWKPECLNGCNFTEEFKAKYPTIVEE
jgi:hypothetical protein